MDDNNCQICLSNIFANSNLLYSCSTKGCNIKVHKGCYGINSNDTWVCQRCHEYGKAIEKPCDLCPTSKGPIKKSLKAGWVHIICALYVPEAYFLKPETLEKLSYSQTALHESKNKHCYICLEKQRQDNAQKGLKILCQHEGCKMYFHATCGLNAGNLMEEMKMNEPGTNCGNGKMQVVNYVGYCNQHRLQHKKEGIADKVAFNSPPNLNTLYAKIPARYKRAQDTQVQATTSSNSGSSKFGSKLSEEPVGKEPKNFHKNATDTMTAKDLANLNNGNSNSSKSTSISSGLEWMKGAGGSNVTSGTGGVYGETNLAKGGFYKIPKRKSEPIIMEKVEEREGTNKNKDDTTSKKSCKKDSTSSSESGCGSHHSKLAMDQGGKKGSSDSLPKNDKSHQGSLARSSSYNPTSGNKKNNRTTSSSTSKGGIVISSDYFLAGAKSYLTASNTKHNNNDISSQSSEPRKLNAESSKCVATKERGDKQHVTTTPAKSSSTTAKGSPGKAASNKGGRDDGKETPSKSSKLLSSQPKKPGSLSTSTEQRRALASDIARKIVSHEAPDKLCSSGGKGKTDPALSKEGTTPLKKQRHENELEPTKGPAKRVKVEDSPITPTTIVLGKKSTIPLLIKPPTQQSLPTPLEVEKGESSESVGRNKARTLSEAVDNGVQPDDTISAYFAKYRRFKSGPSSSVSTSPSDDDKSKITKEVVVKAQDSLEETKADSSASIATTSSDVFLIASPQPYSLNLIAELETENKQSVAKPATTKTDEPEVCKSELETDDDNKPSSNPAQPPSETHSISDILSKTSPPPSLSTPAVEISLTTTTSHKMELVPDVKESEDKIVSRPVPEIVATAEPEKMVISEVEVERGVDVVICTKDLLLSVVGENSEIQTKSSRPTNDNDQDCPNSTSSSIEVTVERVSKTEPFEGKMVVANTLVPKHRDRECDSEEGLPRPFLASPPQQHRSGFLFPPPALAYHSPPSSSLLYDPLGGGGAGGAATLPYPPHPLRYDPYLFNMATAMFGPPGPTHPNNPVGPSYFDSANAYHLSWAANAYAAGLFGPPLLPGPASHYPNLPAGSLQQQQQSDFVGVKDDYLSPKQPSKTGQQGKMVAEERAFFGNSAESLEQAAPLKSLSHHKARQAVKGAVAVSTSSVAGKGAEGKKSARGSAVSLHAEQQHVAINIPASSAIEQYESPTVTHGGGGVKRKASATFSTPAQSRALAGSTSGSAKKRQQQLSRVQETIAAVAAAVSTTPISTSTTPKSVVAQGVGPQAGKGKTLAAPKPSLVDSSSAAPIMDESDNSTVSLEDPGAQRSSAKQTPSSIHQQHFISKELNPALLAGIGMPYVNEGAVKGISAPAGRFVPAAAYYGSSSDAAETNSLARMEFISTHAAYMLAPSLMLSNNRIPSYSDVLTMTTNASFLNNPQYMVSRERTQSIFNPASYASGLAMGLKAGQGSLDFEPRSRSFSVEAASERGNLVSPNSAMKKTIAPETWENVIQAHVDSFMRTMPGEKASFDLNTFLQSLAAQVDENKVNESKLSKLRMRAGQLALENAQLSDRLNALLGSGNLEIVHTTLTAPPVIS